MMSSRMYQKVEILDPGCFTPLYDVNLGLALVRLGWWVEWVTSKHQFGQPPEVRNIGVREVFFKGLERFSLAGSGRLRQAPKIRRMLKLFYYPTDLYAYHRLLLRKRPGVIHVQWALLPLLDAAFWQAWQRRGWKVVFTCHDPSIPRGSMPRVIGSLNKHLCSSANAVIVHGHSAREILERRGVKADLIAVVPPGPPTLFPASDRNRARRRLHIAPRLPVLLFFGYIKPYKGLPILLKSLPHVKAAVGRVILLIAGELMEPWLRYRDLIQELGVKEDLRWSKGYVSDELSSLCFAAADLIVLPYVQASHSGVVLNAYAYQRPVVASAVGGIPEMLEDGISGLLVPPEDPIALAEAIIRVLADRQLAADMALRGRQLIDSRFNWEEIARQTVEIYRRSC